MIGFLRKLLCGQCAKRNVLELDGEYPIGSFFWAMQQAKAGKKVTTKWKYYDPEQRYFMWGSHIEHEGIVLVNDEKSIAEGRYEVPRLIYFEDVMGTDWYVL